MRRTAIAAVLACALLLTVSIVSPALGGPSMASVAKTAKKALKVGKSAGRAAGSAKRTANSAHSLAATANGKADQALARPVVTANGITAVDSTTTFIPPLEVGLAVATCPGGQRAISGGGTHISGFGDGLAVSRSDGPRSGWFVIAVNNSSATTSELQATAYCAPAGGAVAARRNTLRAEVNREVARLERKLGR